MTKDEATPSSPTSSAPREESEDEGELKLTGNVFQVVDNEGTAHQFTVTLESVLMGE